MLFMPFKSNRAADNPGRYLYEVSNDVDNGRHARNAARIRVLS